jgi:threonine/homoserine/homoserine lactone efflux protein
MVHLFIQIIFAATGVIALLAAILDWEWFFTTENTRYLVKRFKRKGARWIYGIIGVLFIAAAIYFYLQVKKL